LLTGVIVMAPLLSLSLHQSHDPLFELAEKTLGAVTSDADAKALGDRIRSRLASQRRFYNWLNPFYLLVWGLAIAFMAVFVMRLVLLPLLDGVAFRDAMIFLCICASLCVLFAIISFLFFMAVRPGITKLEFFMEYLNTKYPSPANCPVPPAKHIHWTRQLVGWLVPVTAAVLGVWWLVSSSSHPAVPVAPRKVTIAVNSTAIASAPVFLADQEPLADAEGIALDMVRFASGRFALDALMGGQADVATTADFPIVAASVNRPDLRILLTLTQSPIRVVARSSCGITRVADLSGKKVGTLVGASPDYFLDRLLARQNVPAKSVTRVNLQPEDMVQALKERDVCAITIWEPFAQNAIREVGSDAVFFEDKTAYLERFNLVTTSEVIDRHRADLASLVQALVQAREHLAERREDTVQAVASATANDPSVISAVWPGFTFPVGEDTGLPGAMATIDEWLAGSQKRPARSADDMNKITDYSILRNLNKR